MILLYHVALNLGADGGYGREIYHHRFIIGRHMMGVQRM